MCPAARLPWPIAAVTDPLGRDHVAAGEDAAVAGHHVGSDLHDAVGELDAGERVDMRAVDVLPDREDDACRR